MNDATLLCEAPYACRKGRDLYTPKPTYPSTLHEQAANAVVEHFRGRPHVKAILLTNSCARGKATVDSCLDMLIIHEPSMDRPAYYEMTQSLADYVAREPVFASLKRVGRFSELDPEFTDAVVQPSSFRRGPVSGPDHLELEIGNTFVYSSVLWEADSYFRDLRNGWLPYYGEELRRRKLAEALGYFRNTIDHIEPFANRGFGHSCVKRLLIGLEEFLQALFISRRIYPIAYDKHLPEQIIEILGEEALYPKLAALFEIHTLDARSLIEKGNALSDLMSVYVRGDA